ncbi:hypothetical protein X961_5784 [Burkholderia pseudomallei MSHR5613]|nr:hypothetical protein X961_5784 [Burkholderia pseudomallei MSHR5613]
MQAAVQTDVPPRARRDSAWSFARRNAWRDAGAVSARRTGRRMVRASATSQRDGSARVARSAHRALSSPFA